MEAENSAEELGGVSVSELRLAFEKRSEPGHRRVQISASVSDTALWVPENPAADSVSNESGVSFSETDRQNFDENVSDWSGRSGEECEAPQNILEEAKEQAMEHLHHQLKQAQEELKKKNEKCAKLSQMQETVDREIEELTASLFQEAYKMVAEANEKRVHSEKLLKEANGKIEVLQAEVEALKMLVMNYTPSSHSSKHRASLPPPSRSSGNSPKKGNLNQSGSIEFSTPGKSKFSLLSHKRNNSDSQPAVSVCSECGDSEEDKIRKKQLEFREVDPIYHKEFTSWREKQDLFDKEHPFLKRVYEEEIMPCLNFHARELSEKILIAIEDNTVIMEQYSEAKPKPRTCALSCVPRICPFRLKSDNEEEWLYISQLCRNRIASVCDFFTYLRYLQVGLVKCGVHEAYWEVVRLRKNMCLAKLGMGFLPAAGRKDERN